MFDLVFPSLHTDKIKDAVVAKIAMQASDLYADAYSNMQVGSVKSMWDKVREKEAIKKRSVL